MMRNLVLGLVLAAAVGAGALPAQATPDTTAYEGRAGAVMQVPLNKSQTLRLDRAYAKALIGNPEIADVLPTSINSIYVMGKKIGSTNLTIYDRKGGLVAVVDVMVGPDAMGLKKQLADLMPAERISVSVSNDSLILQGNTDSPASAERIATIAETFAPKKVLNLMSVNQPQQVLLEVRFAEMTRGTVKQLGISSVNYQNSMQNPLTANSGGISVPAINPAANPYSALINVLGNSLQIKIDALEQQGLIHTLAQPNLVALSGESASFLAGGEFPVPTGVDAFGRLSIEFKQFGVSLAFVPTVIGDGLINLSVAPEVSSLDQSAGIQLSGIQIPGLKVRRAKTALELRDGEAFAMAGLIQSDFNDTVKAIPLLGRIPVLGALFRSTYFNRNETELVIVVTPHIVKPVRPVQIALPTDRVVQPSDTDLLLNGRTERPGPLRPLNGVKPGGLDADYGHVVK